MTLVLQIVLAVVVLAGLITVIMSVKNWHWAQMLLLLCIFFSSIGALVLVLEVFRIHRTFRSKIPGLEAEMAELELKIDALKNGTGDQALAGRIFPAELPFNWDEETRMPGMGVWTRRLQDEARRRGRVWRGVTMSGPVDPATSRVAVTMSGTPPGPHGLKMNTVVYVFEQGEPNVAAPDQGAKYLGAFRVVEERPDGVVLEAVIRLDERSGPRVARSPGPWSLYESMPADTHELFAGRTEEELRSLLPAASVEEYLRYGQPAPKPAAGDAFDPNIYMEDEAGHRVGPDNADRAVKWLYDRQLRDYDYLFAAANRALIEMLAQRAALREDIKKLAAANETAKQLGELRLAEQKGLTADFAHMEQDRQTAESLLATIERQLANARRLLSEAFAENSQMAEQLRAMQLQMLEALEASAPAPAADGLGP